MKSKEALENVNNYLILNCHSCKNDDCKHRLDNKLDCIEWWEIIKQDLDLLQGFKDDHHSMEKRNIEITTENEKLKKVIEILKEKLELPLEDDFDVFNKDDIHLYRLRIKCLINEEEYDLLKEYFR